jgi:vancomycin permeability regulator SanA
LLLAGSNALVWLNIRNSTQGYIYSTVEETPERPVALVFGAGVRGLQPSDVLLDRMLTAVALYKAGKVRKLLVSGDNGSLYYNEVAVMRRIAMLHGVPGRDVVKDHAGFRTYDSCYRARDIFGVHSAILVTQEFHMPRAIYMARKMGIDAVGLTADRRDYAETRRYELRERLACSVCWIQMNITHPRPRFLGPKLPLFQQVASASRPSGIIP